MLQKHKTIPVLGAVLVIGTAGLLLQKPYLGVTFANQPQLASTYLADPSSSTLLALNDESVQKEAIETSMPEPTKIAEVVEEHRVASADESNKTVFVDTINRTLPPVVEKHTASIDLVELIKKYAEKYGADPDMMIAIARCESGFNETAVSPSGAYKGVYQFVASTWQSNRRAMNENESLSLMLNAEESIKTAAFKMGRDGYDAWPVCSQKARAALSLN